MEKTSKTIDVYLGKLFAGEVVRIDEMFQLEPPEQQDYWSEQGKKDGQQESMLHS